MPQAKDGSTPAPIPLTALHVANGQLIHVSGRNSHGEWDCYAIICNVDHKAGSFQIMTFDDMKLVNQQFHIEPDGSDTRQSMQLADHYHAQTYVKFRVKEKSPASYWQAIKKAVHNVRTHNRQVTVYKAQARHLGFI